MGVPLVPLFGHQSLQDRLRASVERGAMPNSLLLHGPRGVGKQRLALWLGEMLLCTSAGTRPCGTCEACRFTASLAHPDLAWFFPQPRPSGGDPSRNDVLTDYADARAERLAAHGLYAAPSGSEGIFVGTVRALVYLAAQTPALGARKVFIVGDAERMVPQEGAEYAANAFLKLLEEPPGDTTLVLTSSEPGSLLPTIRSRVVSVRVPRIADADVRRFVEHPAVAARLDADGVPRGTAERVRLADGAPGMLLGAAGERDAAAIARSLLEAADGSVERADAIRAIISVGGSRARGAFTDALDSLVVLLRDRARQSAEAGRAAAAVGASQAIELVEDARLRAAGNINPQLLAAWLVRQLKDRLS